MSKLAYKLIKRKYRLKDQNFADWFLYSSRTSFYTSTMRALLISKIETLYNHYTLSGLNAALKCTEDLVKPLRLPPGRSQEIKEGLEAFIKRIESLERKELTRDPRKGPVKDPIKTKNLTLAQLNKKAQKLGYKNFEEARRKIGKKEFLNRC